MSLKISHSKLGKVPFIRLKARREVNWRAFPKAQSRASTTNRSGKSKGVRRPKRDHSLVGLDP